MQKDKIYYERNLPHIQPVGATFFITCSLKDAIPKAKLLDIKERYFNRKNSIDLSQNKKQINYEKFFARRQYVLDIEKLLHAKNGPSYLKDPDISRILLARIESYHLQYYKLLALSIMPNHFHMLIDTSVQLEGILEPTITPKDYVQLDKIMQLIKGGSSRYINQWRKIEGQQVWENESFDIYIRNEKMLKNVLNYIEQNPVRAGLARKTGEHAFTFANWDLVT